MTCASCSGDLRVTRVTRGVTWVTGRMTRGSCSGDLGVTRVSTWVTWVTKALGVDDGGSCMLLLLCLEVVKGAAEEAGLKSGNFVRKKGQKGQIVQRMWID